MKKVEAHVDGLEKIADDVFLLRFESPYLATTSEPGQFIHIRLDSAELLLRRPFSIHKIRRNKVYVLFRVRGKGTRALSLYKKDASLDIVGPLGRGFDYKDVCGDTDVRIILVAGGMGVAPLVFLAQKLTTDGKGKHTNSNIRVLLGAKRKNEVFCKNDFKRLGCEVSSATEDGSIGYRGDVTDLLKNRLKTIDDRLKTNLYACGPKEMFAEISKVVKKYPNIDSQVSFEQFMGCGIGLCRACVIRTKQGYRRVCKDGPVFNIKEIF